MYASRLIFVPPGQFFVPPGQFSCLPAIYELPISSKITCSRCWFSNMCYLDEAKMESEGLALNWLMRPLVDQCARENTLLCLILCFYEVKLLLMQQVLYRLSYLNKVVEHSEITVHCVTIINLPSHLSLESWLLNNSQRQVSNYHDYCLQEHQHGQMYVWSITVFQLTQKMAKPVDLN